MLLLHCSLPFQIFDQVKKNPQPYKGERSKGAIVTAAKKMKTAGQKSEQAPPSDKDTDRDTDKAAPAPAPEPPKPVEVVQLTSSDVFTELCKGTGVYVYECACVIFECACTRLTPGRTVPAMFAAACVGPAC